MAVQAIHTGDECPRLDCLAGFTLNSKVDKAAAGNGISERKVMNVGPEWRSCRVLIARRI